MSAPVADSLDPRATHRGSPFVRFLRRPAGVISLAIIVLIILVAVFAPLLAPYDPNLVDFTQTGAGSSGSHPLGGDSSGRDELSRLIFGTRTTLWGALVAIGVSLVLGVPSGVAAGYFGRTFDRIATWISDALQSVPGMIILLIVAAGSRNNFNVLMITMGVFMAPGYFRLARSTTITVRNEPYVDAARVSGLGHLRIMSRHVVRAVYPPVVIQTALTAGMAMGMQAGLQFLGIGGARTPGWGAMMNDGFTNMRVHPQLLLWPSLALGISIAALAVMGSTFADVISPTAPPARRRKSPALVEQAAASGDLVHDAEQSAVRVQNLRVGYQTPAGEVEVVHGIDLDVAPGEVLGVVGESGSGKSQTVFSILELLPNGGHGSTDAIWIGGQDVSRLSAAERHKLLGHKIGYIPQEPMTNLDPAFSIGKQLTEPLRAVHGLSRVEARQRAVEMLNRVGINDPERVLRCYPHELSGGMAQRILVAGAIAGNPSVLVADEPTTALDVTVQAEVLQLLRELQQEDDMALIIVTHNFGVVADLCDRVAVMQDGKIVESGPVQQIFTSATADYTRELIAASLDTAESRRELDASRAPSSPGDHDADRRREVFA